MHNVARSLVVGLALVALAAPALAQTLSVKGPSRTVSLTAADLEAMPRTRLTVGSGASALAYEGVSINALLTKAGAVTGQDMHGGQFAAVVVVRSRDGYQTVLSLAETDPSMRTEPVIVADRMNGAKIDNREGPFRLVVGGDLRQARSARQVDAVELRSIAP